MTVQTYTFGDLVPRQNDLMYVSTSSCLHTSGAFGKLQLQVSGELHRFQDLLPDSYDCLVH